MQFFLNQATNLFVRALGLNATLTAASFKARDTLALDVWFHDETATGVELPVDSLIVFILKTGVEDAATTLALADTWAAVDAENKPGLYRALLSLNTDEVIDAIGDLAKLVVFGELSWSTDAGASWESSNTLSVTIQNDVYKGVEGTPLPLPTPDEWLTARSVRYDAAQSLTEPEKLQALENIGVPALTYTGVNPNNDAPIAATSDFNGDPIEGTSFDIGGVFYQFLATPSPTEIQLGVTPADSWANAAAFLTANDPLVTAVVQSTGITVGARTTGPGGNSIAVSGDADFSPPTGTLLGGGYEPLPATYLNQECNASTATWKWDGSEWIPIRLLNGRSITRNDADTAYFSIGVDAIGLPTTTPFSLT